MGEGNLGDELGGQRRGRGVQPAVGVRQDGAGKVGGEELEQAEKDEVKGEESLEGGEGIPVLSGLEEGGVGGFLMGRREAGARCLDQKW